MPKFKNSNAPFWEIFKQCALLADEAGQETQIAAANTKSSMQSDFNECQNDDGQNIDFKRKSKVSHLKM